MLALPACPKAVRSSGCPQHQHELCCSTVTTLHRHTCNWEAFALQRWWVSSAKTTCEARKVRGRRHYLECHSVQNGYEGKHMVLHSSLSFVKNNPSAFPSIIAAVLPEDKKKKREWHSSFVCGFFEEWSAALYATDMVAISETSPKLHLGDKPF